MKGLTFSTLMVTILLSFGCASIARMSDSSTSARASMFNPADRKVQWGSHPVTIKRSYVDVKQAKLIQLAEATMPKKEDVIKAMRSRGRQAFDTANTENPWWYDAFDGVFIPYAITAEGLSYYVALSDSFRKGNYSETKGIKMEETSLVYTADIAIHEQFNYEGETFNNVSVVTMNLSWYQYCGNVCAMRFEKKRIVIFDDKGLILRIFHDGITNYTVS